MEGHGKLMLLSMGRGISFICNDSAVPSLADKRQECASLALELLENSCWCVQVFELSLCSKHTRVWNKRAAYPSACSIHKSDSYARGRPTNSWDSRQLFPSTVSGLDLFLCLPEAACCACGIC